ncbi:MAG: cytochrome c biogenesis CcdA family protein [Armatimonadota bacterium]
MKAVHRLTLSILTVLACAAAPAGPAAAQPEPPASPAAAPKDVYIGYFHTETCSICRHVKHQLEAFDAKHPNVHVETLDWHERDTYRIFRATMMRLGTDEKTIEKLRPPVIVIGEWWGQTRDATEAMLNSAIAAQGNAASERIWDVDQDALARADAAIRRYFSSYGPLGVIVLGLVDGINPCAIATLIFFVSYLAFLGRQGKDVLVAGLAFAAGIWIMYFAIGLGLSRIILGIKNMDALRMGVYIVMLIITGLFAILSFLDFRKLREGRAESVTLQLPMGLKRRIHAVIRERTRASLIGVGAFTAGLIVSCIELACTGQVYLPAVAFITDVPTLKTRVIMWLVIYNLAFVLPLLGITGAAYFGASSGALGKLAQRHAAGAKLLMALFFVAIAIYFAVQLNQMS